MRYTLQATGVDQCRTFPVVPSFFRGMILPLTLFAAVSCEPAPLPTDPLTEPLVEDTDGTSDDGSGDTSSDDQSSDNQSSDDQSSDDQSSDDQSSDPPIPTTIDLSGVPSTVEAGDSVELVAVVKDQYNEPIPDIEIYWSSSDTMIAKVTVAGMLYALSTGAVTVGAEVIVEDTPTGEGASAPSSSSAASSSSPLKATHEVSVVESGSRTATSIDLSAVPTSLQTGDSTALIATVYDQDGQLMSDVDVSWSSSDATVAEVTTAGMLYALSGGTVSVKAELAQNATTLSESQAVSITSSDTETDTETEAVASGPVPAFPGAEGYGAMALSTCDRSQVRVIRVTNLGDSGYGTLREAFSIAENVPDVLKVVVFDVAGYIDLRGRIDFSGNCLYVAGQTAPGGGITIRNDGGTSIFLREAVHDVAVRYLRMRAGYSGDHRGNINLIVGSGHDIILDHLSLSWTADKVLAFLKYDAPFSETVQRISVQRSILSEVFADHPTAFQITGEDNDGAREWRNIHDISVHDNLLAHNSHRNPQISTYGTQVINNVVYNWRQGAVQSSLESKLDVIGNYFKTGPMTDSRYLWEVTWRCGDSTYEPSLHVARNVGPNNEDPSADNWTGESRMTACYYDTGETIGEPLPKHFRRTTPLASPAVPVSLASAFDAYKSIMGDVGASARVSCRGSWTDASDAVDTRVLNEVAGGTGTAQPVAHEDDVGGFPAVSPATACTDSDKDGMPNDYEVRYGLNPNNGGDIAGDPNQNGYTNLEEYLNGSDPTR